MPRESEKQKLIHFLIENAKMNIIFTNGLRSFIKEIKYFDEDIFIVMSFLRGCFENVPKSVEWRSSVLNKLDENRFRQMMRVNHEQFRQLLSLICDDPKFNKPHAQKQFSLDIQLAIVLYRLGSSGEGAAIKKIAAIFGVGDGETVYKITRRIFKAFRKLQSKFIFWPDANERKAISNRTYHELPDCIGYIDGMEVKLADAPVTNHQAYFSKNRVYSIKAQVVCDDQLKIRHVSVGHFDSNHDARMFRSSPLYTEKENFFSSEQWIAGDSAYPLQTTLITPYRSNSQQLNRTKRIAFNLRHSRYRVRIEHCFGILKERFGSLKELRIRVRDEKSHNFCSEWFMTCCVLHNVLIKSSEFEDYELNANTDDGEGEVFSNTFSEFNQNNPEAEIKRQNLYSYMFE